MDGSAGSSSPEALRVLCVLSQGQADDYRDEFLEMGGGRAEFLFEESPEDALEQLGDINPALVIVGMDLGSMEGLEFLAMLMRSYPSFMQKVLVLPERDDPFPPMLQFRDPSTGRSVTEQTDLGALQDLIRTAIRSERPQALQLPQQSSPLAKQWGVEVAASIPPESVPAFGASTPDVVAPAPAPLPDIQQTGALGPPPQSAPPSMAGPSSAAPSLNQSRPKLLLIAAAALVLLILVVLMMRSGGEPEAGSGAERMGGPGAAAPATPAVAPAEPEAAPDEAPGKAAAAPEANDEAAAEAEAEAEPPAKEDAETEAPAAPAPVEAAGALEQRVTLPLFFPKGRAAYRVDDQAAFDRIVKSFAAALEQNPDKRLEVGGHTSEEGSKAYNVTLGRKRAMRLRTDLVALGVPMRRMVVKNYVATKEPLPDEPRLVSARRRVTLRLVE